MSRDYPMKLGFVALWLLLAPMTVTAQMDHAHSAAPAEDCTKLSPELQAVVAAMDGSGLRIKALPRLESSLAVEPGIHKLVVALRPLSEVGLMGKEIPSRQTPGREEVMDEKTKPNKNVENFYGGFVRLAIPKDGMYRISADSTLWIEVIDGEKPLERIKVAPRLHCGRIHKSLVFPLKRDGSYWLELSNSKRPDAGLLIAEETEH